VPLRRSHQPRCEACLAIYLSVEELRDAQSPQSLTEPSNDVDRMTALFFTLLLFAGSLASGLLGALTGLGGGCDRSEEALRLVRGQHLPSATD
jgi:hypothetical protein